ncbi:MAG TPA: RagB/SusD family nutrient uptake outer membrane protein [Candidatus Parabacteroides intestinigallinarum]|uniref:RagB/SusD family nutrient uptake outer membrane protein n=1 Tax=Candidatus Parabacteroides intestinigallinarum TaxID=2838722 RepID=A0A9D1XSP6_9BACT|nr:RagB/SusD family nutrient uptake outer membrane protein [Candidatus Parabacteroides intestinigallinarum]
MKKKTILSLLAGASLLFSMPSCMDLDETVYDKLAADNFGVTETEINALIGTVNNTLRRYFTGDYYALDDQAGSMSVKPTRQGGDWYDGGQYREIYMHDYTAQTSCIKNAWDIASESIGTCNAALSVVENSTCLTDEKKAQTLASIRGVRAFWFYKMVDLWGNVPMVISSEDKELPTCRPRQEVFDWLVSEVEEIAEQCPNREGNYGQFTKGAAYSLLAKLYLNADAWGVTTSTNNYQKVIEACDKVMAMGYILEPNWKDNFSLNNENSREAILAAIYSESDTQLQNQLHYNTLHYKDNIVFGASFSAWNGLCAQPDYARLFPEDDPRREGSFLMGKQYDPATGEVLMTAYDYELDHTLEITMMPGTEYDGTNWGAVLQQDGYRAFKWPYSSSVVDAMGNDYHIFRLADIYLMKAEALLRGGGSTAEATQLVNDVRTRAYGNSDHNYATVTLEDVQLERRLEFAWELTSRQDDIRFGCYTKGMWSSSNCERKADKYLELFPVSQDAWQSNPNLTQNPGYAAFAQ